MFCFNPVFIASVLSSCFTSVYLTADCQAETEKNLPFVRF